MMKGRNNGKKLLAVRIVSHAFEIIHLLTDQNPIQVRPLFSALTLRFADIFLTCRFLSMPLLTLDLVKTPHGSAHKVLFVAKLLTFRLCEESTKPSRFSPLVYAQLILYVCSSHGHIRHENPHFAMSNQSPNASRMNSSTQQKVLRTRTQSRYVTPSLNLYYSNLAILLTEKGRTRACRQVKSVKVPFPRGVRLLRRFFLSPHILYAAFAFWVASARFRMSPTCLSYGNRVRFPGKTESTCPLMQQFESLVERRLTHVYHGTMRSSETFLEVTVHGLGINRDNSHAWIRVV